MSQQIFEALYTPQLIQKRKKWHDGKCLYFSRNKKLVLLDEDGHTMAERFWFGDSSPEAGTTFQLDRYLVELDTLLHTVSHYEGSDSPSETRKIPSRPLKPLSRPGPTLGRPLSDVLQDASMRIKPLGSGPLEKRVKRVRADKFGGLSPALLGLEAPVKLEVERPSTMERSVEPIDPFVKLEPQDRGTSSDNNPDSPVKEASTKRDTFKEDSLHFDHPDDSELFVGEPFLPAAGRSPTNFALSHDLGAEGTQDGDSDDLFSDPEVEVLDIKHTPRARRSLFEDIPDECPIEGPWTKEAYLLFSWHPPQPKVKEEPV